ncbi:MAG: VanW family protein [Candidatus Margulisiibacteriota bacterium]
MRTLIKVLSLLAAISLVVTAGLVSFDFFQSQEKFPAQTFIGQVNVSGLDQSEALDKLEPLPISQVFVPLISLEAGKISYSFSPEALGVGLDTGRTVREAFRFTHRENYLKELKRRIAGQSVPCPLYLTVDDEQLGRVVGEISAELRATARDATLIFYEETGGFHIEPEVPGREVKVAATLQAIKAGLAKGEHIFPISLKLQPPQLTEKLLRVDPPVQRLSAYTTYYGSHDSPNRIHNIKLVASWIDGTLLLPGEEFSVANVLGDVTTEQGFKEAFVIVKGELVPLLGGGSCQIATTLYNAIQGADIKVLQRRNHSMYFNIYPLGRDAGVYPGQLDFRFQNDTGHPIMIKALATNRRLSFRIYGTPSGKTVKFSYPQVFMKTENGFVPSTVKAVLAADAPFKTIVTRTVFDAAGQQLKEEKIFSVYTLYGEKTNVPIARPEPR